MLFQKIKPYLIGIGIVETVGFLSGILSREGVKRFQEFVTQPPLTPPGWVFPVVWGILYALMGFSLVRVWKSPSSTPRAQGINLFVIQLVLNFFWSLIFFNAQAYGLAVIWVLVLWVVVLKMILRFWKADPLAAKLQIPYLIWLTLAAYLSIGVWWLNR